jgi:hypothetical protein
VRAIAMAAKRCVQCQAAFEVTDRDLSFYEKVSPSFSGGKYLIPAPSHCYSCRQQRKLAWRNERTLYWRTCGLTGKRIMSTYAPDSGLKVYNCEDWFSDRWDGAAYGREFDFNRPFFEQFNELLAAVPVPAAFTDSTSVNTEYANLSKRNKNCYFIFAANDNDECFYTTYLQRNRNICDCFFIFDSELCYECIDCYNCYNLQYSQYCKNCRDSAFLLSCAGCSDCFCCLSLSNKRYHILNKAYSRDDYQKELIRLHSDPAMVEKARSALSRLSERVAQKYYAGLNNAGVTGDHLFFSKNSQMCFDCTYLEDCKYCTWLHRCKDCYDHYAWGLPGELGYENHLVGDGFYNVRFCEECFTGVSDLLYCRHCINGSKSLFGCVGLQHKEHCILNRQYSKADYDALAPKIITHMRQTGEWGEFFPERFSPYGYNETVGKEYFPLTEEEVRKRGWKWQEHLPYTTGKETLALSAVPADIADVADKLPQAVLACSQCSRNYRITSEELKFYRRLELPVPRLCFNCRYAKRRTRRNPRQLWDRPCGRCGKAVMTSFGPESPARIVCEECYLAEVY